MARGSKQATGRRRGRRGGPGAEGRELLQLAGWFIAVAAVMVLVPTCRVLYWWLERDRYVIAPVEVVSEGAARMAKTIRVREAATGTELWIDPLDFGELTSEGTLSGSIAASGMRFTSWFNPAARASAGIVLFDQRLVSRARHPELATADTVAGHVSVLAVLVAVAAMLIGAPRRPRG